MIVGSEYLKGWWFYAETSEADKQKWQTNWVSEDRSSNSLLMVGLRKARRVRPVAEEEDADIFRVHHIDGITTFGGYAGRCREHGS